MAKLELIDIEGELGMVIPEQILSRLGRHWATNLSLSKPHRLSADFRHTCARIRDRTRRTLIFPPRSPPTVFPQKATCCNNCSTPIVRSRQEFP